MRILIQNSGYHLKNYGDLAMLVSAYDQILRLHPDAVLRIFTSDPDELRLHCPKASPVSAELGLRWAEGGLLARRIVKKLDRSFPRWTSFWMDKRLRKARQVRLFERIIAFYNFRYHRQINQLWDEIESADIIIATGGGFLTTTFFGQGRAVLATMAIAEEMRKRIAFFGQGVGPFEGKFSFMEKHVVNLFRKSFYIGFRENIYSSQFVRKYSLTNTEFTFDDAVMSCSREESLATGSERNTLGVNLRIAEYSGLDQSFLQRFSVVMSRVSAAKEISLVPLPIALGSGDSDVRALSELAELSNFTFETEIELSSVDAILKRVSCCKVIVTCSYHAGVFGACYGIPVILISANGYYDQKLQGLQQAVGSEGIYFISLSDASWPQKLEENIIDLFSENESATGTVRNRVNNYSEIVKKGYSLVFSSQEHVKKV